MPSPATRFAGEAAFLVLVALGLGLAQFDAIAIGVVMFVAWVLVALLERASAKEAARARAEAADEPPALPPPHVQRVEVEPARTEPVAEGPEPPPKPEPEPTPAVNQRRARAILASGPPPLPPEPPKPKPKPEPNRRRPVDRRREPPRAAPPPPDPSPPPPPPPPRRPEPEPVPVISGPPREWNLWELDRAVRGAGLEGRRDEWNALLMHLREFANADGDLPIAFDGLVRESFSVVLATSREPAAAS